METFAERESFADCYGYETKIFFQIYVLIALFSLNKYFSPSKETLYALKDYLSCTVCVPYN